MNLHLSFGLNWNEVDYELDYKLESVGLCMNYRDFFKEKGHLYGAISQHCYLFCNVDL